MEIILTSEDIKLIKHSVDALKKFIRKVPTGPNGIVSSQDWVLADIALDFIPRLIDNKIEQKTKDDSSTQV